MEQMDHSFRGNAENAHDTYGCSDCYSSTLLTPDFSWIRSGNNMMKGIQEWQYLIDALSFALLFLRSWCIELRMSQSVCQCCIAPPILDTIDRCPNGLTKIASCFARVSPVYKRFLLSSI